MVGPKILSLSVSLQTKNIKIMNLCYSSAFSVNHLIPVLLLLGICLMPLQSQAQRQGGNTLTVSTNFNYTPPLRPYSFRKSYIKDFEYTVLNFITRNSGTFVLVEGNSYEFVENGTYHPPSNLIGLGASFQIWNENGLFQDFSLTRLSLTQSSHQFLVSVIDDEGNEAPIHSQGIEERSGAVGVRYEVGKYFGERRRDYPNFRFGLSAGLESTFYAHRTISLGPRPLSTRGHMFTIDLSLIPVLSFQPTKRLMIDAKVIPNFLIADLGTIEIEDPSLPEQQRRANRKYDLPVTNVSASLMVRYVIKEPKRGRRRSD